MTGLILRLLILLPLIAVPSSGIAADALQLKSDVFVERKVTGGDGVTRIVLEQPRTVTPGDTLLFVLAYRNGGDRPASNFVVTNPLPAAVALEDAGDDARYSVDGGRSWGRLSELAIRAPDGRVRPAGPTDVTHIQWKINKMISAGGTGKVMFRGLVK